MDLPKYTNRSEFTGIMPELNQHNWHKKRPDFSFFGFFVKKLYIFVGGMGSDYEGTKEQRPLQNLESFYVDLAPAYKWILEDFLVFVSIMLI